MLDNKILKNRLISRRTFIIIWGKILLFFCLFLRLIYLQFFKREEFENLSKKNRLSVLVVPPIRGIITDKTGNILAENVNAYSLKLDRRQSVTYKDSLNKVFEILNYNDKKIEFINEKIKNTSIRIPVILDNNLSWNEVAKIEERLYDLPGIFIESSDVRVYRHAESMSHIIGYLGKASENDIKEFDYKYLPEIQVGKTGIEKYYENFLQGKFGYRQMEVNAYGLYVGEVDRVKPVNGKDLALNIDLDLQNTIFNMLDSRGSSVAVMDVKTGRIISLVSSPSYDSNEFIGGVSHSYWNNVRDDIYRPLINKVIQSQYPPGSTFKIITVLAALENGVDPSLKYTCTGSVTIGNRKFNCWFRHGHGTLDMLGGFRHSCNCYMYNLALLIGHDKIINTAKKFGFGEKTNIDLPSEVRGFVPDRAWKIKNFKYDWNKGDSLNLSIGQGALLVTPIQQVRMAAAIANGGVLFNPRIVDLDINNIKFDHDYETENFRNLDISKNNIDFIQRAMFEVINKQGGTGYSRRSSKFLFAGKTGTSQVRAKKNVSDDLSRDNIEWISRNHGLFVGFAPYNDPKYALSVVVDHGGSGSGAALPIAKKIFEYLI